MAPLQYFKKLKAKHPDAIILFRRGDYYESYNEDALELDRITKCGLNVEATHVWSRFIHSELDWRLPKLIRAGKRIAIADAV